MKKILILGTALLCGFLCRVAAQGVEFRDLTFGPGIGTGPYRKQAGVYGLLYQLVRTL